VNVHSVKKIQLLTIIHFHLMKHWFCNKIAVVVINVFITVQVEHALMNPSV